MIRPAVERATLLRLGALFAPFLAVMLSRALFDTSPAEAAAQLAPTPLPEPAPTPVPVLTDAQSRALQFLASARPGEIISPMTPPRVEAVIIDMPPSAPASAGPDIAPITTDGLALTSVVGDAQGGMAVISGRVLRPGAAVAQGWTLQSINPAARSVIIVHESGRTSELHVNR